jgi:eukaryotic-like serine/threonine-protein kinase
MEQGELFAGRYGVEAQAGQGPVTAVYRAVDVESGRTVALKLFPAAFSSDPRFAIRFREHLRQVAALAHPNLLPILDYGLAEGRYYIVEAWAEGLNLSTYLSEFGPMAPGLAVAVGRQICAAVAAIHEQGLLHRDLKPENIFLLPAGAVRVADAGFGELVSETGLSRTSVMLDGIAYLSPEQARGEPAEQASDVYSSGILLFEMLTGAPPFVSNDLWSVVSMHAEVEAPPAHERNAAVPEALSAVVARALAKRRAGRYAAIAALDEALAALPHPEAIAFPVAPAPAAGERPRRVAPGGWLARQANGIPPEALPGLLVVVFVVAFVVVYLAVSFKP